MRRNIQICSVALFIGASLVVSMDVAAPRHVQSASINVTRLDDPPPNGCPPNDCSLREAIIAANASPGLDTIMLGAGTYTLSIAGTGEDGALTGDLDITDWGLSIQGAGPDETVISGSGLDRVFHVPAWALELNLRDLKITGGTADVGGGIAIQEVSALRAENVGIIGNTASTEGGGIWGYAADLTLNAVAVSGNSAQDGGGGHLWADGAQISSSSFVNNTATRFGGGAVLFSGDFAISDSAFTGNEAAAGGGVWASGIVRFERVLLNGNTATWEGGGVFIDESLEVTDSTIVENSAADGGGFYGGYWIDVRNSTVASNHAGFGGGLSQVDGSLTNTTVSGNTATGHGGGFSLTSLTLINATVVGNVSDYDENGTGDGGAVWGQIEAANTIFWANVDNGGQQDLCAGSSSYDTITSRGYNLVQAAPTCHLEVDLTGNIYDQDPLLAPLADNGGPTRTHALGTGSPAIDAGNPEAPGSQPYACQPDDQRSITRPQRLACDIGAYELVEPGFDGDADGVPDETDNCRYVANPAQENNDGDAQGDPCDLDDDNDGVLDSYEGSHSCLNSFTPDADGDADSDVLTNLEEFNLVTDACDADSDEDGLGDGAEVNTHHTNPLSGDSDGDGLPDAYEVAHGCLLPLAYDSLADPDSDGLSTFSELAVSTEPCVADTDGDACRDGAELGINPSLGGDRNPLDGWDFYDVTADSQVDLSDTLAILEKFGLSSGDVGYVAAFDRYAPIADKPWRTAYAADSAGIDLTDALVNLDSFGHDCSGASSAKAQLS